MRIHFDVICEKCNQHLFSADGLSYRHENAADCDGGEVELPACSVEQLQELLSTEVVKQKIAALNDAVDALLKAHAPSADQGFEQLADVEEPPVVHSASKKPATKKKAAKGKTK